MVLEATIICIDNSEWMRNGDYYPSRIEAQANAVYLVARSKTQSNLDNTVGILTMAGRGARILTTTSDVEEIRARLRDVEMKGEVDLETAIKKAQLALKHRQNKNQQQRIVVFAGSPVEHGKESLELIGENLKKNNVALDIVNFGEQDGGKTEKLEALLASANSNDNSHVVYIPPGPDSLSDLLSSSPIMDGGAGAARGGGDFEFGVDPNIDPELVSALRVSMEEEIARAVAAVNADIKAMDAQDTPLLKDPLELVTPGLGDPYMELSEIIERLKLDGVAKDESSQSDMKKDEEYQSSMSFDLPGADPNDPSEYDLPASVHNELEPEEKKKEEKSANDEK